MTQSAQQLRLALRIGLLGLVLTFAWDLSGWDLALTGFFANTHGFAWRDSWLAHTALHDGGHWLAIGALIVALAHALWPQPLRTNPASSAGPSRAEHLYWLGAVIVCALTIPALKRLSATSCPWELTQFGGHIRYVPHWLIGLTDGGHGHCFPSGHASSAFAFFGLYFLWLPYNRLRARRILLLILALGAAFSWAQLVRGAHFLSHSLWTAWACWAISITALALQHHKLKKLGSDQHFLLPPAN